MQLAPGSCHSCQQLQCRSEFAQTGCCKRCCPCLQETLVQLHHLQCNLELNSLVLCTGQFCAGQLLGYSVLAVAREPALQGGGACKPAAPMQHHPHTCTPISPHLLSFQSPSEQQPPSRHKPGPGSGETGPGGMSNPPFGPCRAT